MCFSGIKNIILSIFYVSSLIFLLDCAGVRSTEINDWIEQHLPSMTIEQKVGQMMIVNYLPQFYNKDNPYFKSQLSFVKEYQVGGVGISNGNPYAVARGIDRLQSVSNIPLFIMADLEWGISTRVNEGTTFLQNMAIGATGSEEYAYHMGAITAQEAKAMGIHVAFAPVLDVNNNPNNIIINTRSYGEEPTLVAKLGSAFIRGLQENGVYATAKHYPGHGDTDIDSHLGLPTIAASDERLHQLELVPFKAAVNAGVKFVMIAHITYSAYQQMEGKPATLDPYFIQKVLREEMGFDGLVITDAMDMGGIVNHYWSGEAAVMAINAGIDMLLYPPNFEATFKFVVNAVKEGRIPISRIDEAVKRILQAKWTMGLNKGQKVDLDHLEVVMSSPENLHKAEEIANASMTLLRDDKHIIPLEAEKLDSILVVTITDREWGYEYQNNLSQEIKRRIPVVKSTLIDTRSGKSEIEEIIAKADAYQVILIGLFVKWGSYKGTLKLPDTTAHLLQAVFKINKPMPVIAFGTPYILLQIPEVPSYLCAYQTDSLAVRAAIRAVFGEIPLTAKLPVSIPGFYRRGDGLEKPMRKMELANFVDNQLFTEAFNVLENAITDSISPGAQVAIIYKNKLIASKGLGYLTYQPGSPEVTTETIYDLSSLTKVAATTLLVMQLYERNQLKLDIPVNSYLPRFQGGLKDSITVRHLLTHSAGIHWRKELWKIAQNKNQALNYIYELPLVYTPGDSMIYSDLGFIILGEIIETITGKTIDQLAEKMIYQPMGMNYTMYNPPKSLLGQIAPTEVGGDLNRGLIHGQVHDENAYFLNGVAPHAGVFSTAEDLAALAQMLLNGGIYRHKRFLLPQTIQYWTSRQNIPIGSERALGWDTPSDEGSSAGDFFSKNSYGHLGFTGTSIWIDPEKQIAIVLLTNRVHPTRERGGIRKLRRDFHNEAMKALLKHFGEEIPEDKRGISDKVAK